MINPRAETAANRGYRTEVRREEDGSWSLLVPALPGLVAVGDRFDEAWAELADVIDLWIESAREQGIPVPEPDAERDEAYSGRFALRMPKTLHAALARCAEAEGTSINTFCVVSLTHAVAYGAIHEPSHARRGFVRRVFEPTFTSNRFAREANALPVDHPNLFVISAQRTPTKVSNAH